MELLNLGVLTAESFRPLIGQAFCVAGSEVALTLSAVEVKGESREPGLRTPFSVFFQLPARGRCPQAIYRLENEQLGALELFLVQISDTEIEAAFS